MSLRRLFRALKVRPRLVAGAVFGVAVALVLPDAVAPTAAVRALVGWNAFASLYLVLAVSLMARSRSEHILPNAVEQDDGRLAILALVVAASIAVLAGVGTQLTSARGAPGAARTAHVALAALTVVTAWGFTQASFALHYAHDFFLARSRGQPDGLQFPGTPDPTYLDFLYFACVIGTSAQTADVTFTTSAMRAVGLAHCVQAFFFNTTVLALAVNLAAGLF